MPELMGKSRHLVIVFDKSLVRFFCTNFDERSRQDLNFLGKTVGSATVF
jgi:hypothetical protein